MTTDDAGREAELRSYLLGTLPAERLEEIDEQVIADAEAHAELQATADDLIHDYLAGDLSAGDRERFESHFLASSRRRERFAFVRDLVAAVGRTQRAPSRPTASVPRPSRLVSLLPWAAALVVGLAAGSWGVGEKRLRVQEMAAAQQREEDLRQKVSAQERRLRDLEQRAIPALPTDGVVIWPLHVGVERGTTPNDSFTVAVDTDWVRLRVPLDDDLRAPSYRASLQTATGKELHSASALRTHSGPAGPTLDVVVPAGLLKRGAYVLSIQRDTGASPQEPTETSFVVR